MKVLAISSIRSDYDLMSELYLDLHNDPEVQFKLIVGGAHNSNSKLQTYRDIVADGLDILIRVESLIDSDTPSSRLKSLSVLLMSVIDSVRDFSPDLIIYAGDREEVMIGALLGGYLSIPTLHFFAGDHAADGHVDNPIRHAASKLSTGLVVSLESHEQRLSKIGEPRKRIFNIGSIALDKFVRTPHLPDVPNTLSGKKALAKSALFIFHPVTEEVSEAPEIVRNCLTTLIENGYHVFVGAPNSDFGNAKIQSVLEELDDQDSITYYGNLSRIEFVNLFRSVSLIVGNSSAGILEAASIPIPAINIGHRQRGRTSGENVLFIGTANEELQAALLTIGSEEFQNRLSYMKNPYGDGDAVAKAISLIKNYDFSSILVKSEDPLYDE